jgi:uncharacterized protein VirK/YbjX
MHWGNHVKHISLATFLAAAIAAVPAIAQQTSATPVSPTPLQAGDNDITRGEVRNFDGFLDRHPEVAEQLRQNPNLVNNPTFLSQHPELREFLKNHPEAAEELKENPRAFMNRERRFDNRTAGDSDITRGEVRNFDGFLDRHPEVAEQLRQNPSLVNNPTFLSQHPELREFLKNHPEAAEELKENPRAFMNRERRFDNRTAGDSDITRGEVRNFDNFLDQHPKVTQELNKNPSLINNPKYVAQHPELKEFLQNHPGVREELKENPGAFMKREHKYERHERAENRSPRH